jgi:hypothetical protein
VTLFLQSRLRQDTLKRFGMKIVRRMSRHRDASRFGGMLELAVTALCRNYNPTLTSEQFEDVANLHGLLMIGDNFENQKPGNGL